MLCQLRASEDGHPSQSPHNAMTNSNSNASSDLSVMVAAQQLLELSAVKNVSRVGGIGKRDNMRTGAPHVNGIIKPFVYSLKKSRLDLGLVNGEDVSSNSSVTGRLCSVDHSEHAEHSHGTLTVNDKDVDSMTNSPDSTASFPTSPKVNQSPRQQDKEKNEQEVETMDLQTENWENTLGMYY